MVGKHYFLKLF